MPLGGDGPRETQTLQFLKPSPSHTPKHCSSFFLVLANSPHIDSCLNLSEIAMDTKLCPQQPKKAS